MPQIGIPNFLPSGGAGGSPALYFAIIRDPEAQARQQQQQRAAPAFNLMPGAQGAFADIKLGPLLGKGAFGRVYRGEQGGWKRGDRDRVGRRPVRGVHRGECTHNQSFTFKSGLLACDLLLPAAV
jgi:hypothetical protein